MRNRIKELRILNNLTLRALSKFVNIDYSYLSKIENGQQKLTREMSLKLAKFFSVDTNYIEGMDHYKITCFTNDLSEVVVLDSFDIHKYGICYTSKFSEQNTVLNILAPNVEGKLLEAKREVTKLIKKIIDEKEIVDSMENRSQISLLYAKEKIDCLLSKKR